MSRGSVSWSLLLWIAVPLLLLGILAIWNRSGPEEAPPRITEAKEFEVGDRRGALVDEVVFTQESDLGKVTELIERGSHHVFASGITNPTIFRRIRDSVRAAHDMSYGTSGELTLNPAGPTFEDGQLNPFYSRKIREALNWLVDRNHITEEIYGGLAVPRYLPIGTAFPDYARLAQTARELEVRYRHDPDRAEAVIRQEMEELGAEKVDGRWMYEGRPVQIRVLIRTEDERRRVGDYIANLMEGLGFDVQRIYRTADEATRIWISGDPRLGRWNIYTGGWISLSINRDEAGNLNFHYTPRGRPEPLWQIYDPDPELDEIADRLERREYQDWEERQELMARGLELAMEDSVRIWLLDQLNIWPRARDVSLAVDVAGGISGSRLWPYTIRFQDEPGGRVVFGTPGLLTEPWNPVAGTNWIFDAMILRSLGDSELLPDPFTGLYWPQRIESAEVTVQEDVPVIRTLDWLTLDTAPEIPVPGDTWIDWDPVEQRFITVEEKYPEGITARTRTRVRYEDDYFKHHWHDGSQISPADLVLGWILTFARADEESRLFDRAYLPSFEVFQRHFRGRRIVSLDPLEIEIYSDQIFPDAEWIVNARTPGVAPWHTLGLGIRAEEAGELAFSSDKADQMDIDWMHFVAGPSLRILDRHLEAAREQNFVPFPNVMNEFLREGEVEERYEALADWREERGHFWVDRGPFYLHSVHPVERSVVVRRFEDFPDPADKWLRFSQPEIPELDLEGPTLVPVGQSAEFELAISFEGEPYPESEIGGVSFLLFDARDSLVVEGEAQPDGEGRWSILLDSNLTRELEPGGHSLEVAVTSNRIALPRFTSQAFAVVPAENGEENP